MKRIALLGASGSIGRNTLEVISNYPEKFKVSLLSVHTQVDFAVEKALELKPEAVIFTDNNDVYDAIDLLEKQNITVYIGDGGLEEALKVCHYDLLVNSLIGGIGLVPTLTAIKQGKPVALANKETMVIAGELVNSELDKHNVSLIPIDSEHSAIFQCLVGEPKESIKRIILTGSGGPFYRRDINEFDDITIEESLAHPIWKMGKKITVDSATLMNKGLEIIEAYWLFGIPLDKINLVIHPQSIIHSMVEFVDGSIKAQMGWPDMKVPIQYALSYPDRLPLHSNEMDFATVKELTFLKPDYEKFPNLNLAIEAIRKGGTLPAVLNAANEEAVHLFLDGVISFKAISSLIIQAMQKHSCVDHPNLDEILEADLWARNFVLENTRLRKTNIG